MACARALACPADPLLQGFVQRAPVPWRQPERRRIDPALAQHALEHENRRLLDQLVRMAVSGGHRHGAQGAGIAGPPGIDGAVQDDAAADERADEEIDEVGMVSAAPEHQLRTAGCGRIVLAEHRVRDPLAQDVGEVNPTPGLHPVARRADRLRPAPELERRRDADARDPVAPFGRQHGQQVPDASAGEVENALRLRKGIDLAQLHADLAQKVHQREIGAASPDLEPDRIGAVGCEKHRHRRLADPSPGRRTTHQETVTL